MNNLVVDNLWKSQEYGVFFKDTLRQKVQPKLPVIDHILYERDTICISAESGFGKSILVLQMLCNLTTGTPFLDTYSINKPHTVLYLQTEGDRSETLERLKCMESGVPINDNNWAHMNLDGICLNTQIGINDFTSMAKETNMQFDVIIIDPLYTTVKGSLSHDEVATDWVRNIRHIRKTYQNCSFIIIHHEGKDFFQQGVRIEKRVDSLFGSTFWTAFVNYNYKLMVKNNIHIFTSGKVRNDKVIDTIELKMLEPEPLMFVYAKDDTSIASIQIRKLLQESSHSLSAKDITQCTQLSKATVYRIIKRLLQNSEIECCQKGNVSVYNSIERK